MWNNLGFLIGEKFNISNEQLTQKGINTKYSSYIKKEYNISKAPYHTSIDVYGKQCFNLLSGVVTGVSHGYDTFTINVRISSGILMRYGNLSQIYYSEGAGVETGVLLGKADNYVSFEYCTTQPSKFTVRVGGDIYYKQDPYPYLIGDSSPQVASYSYDYLDRKFDNK